ncbi:hypothetical protein MMC13_001275 [Lambiella insularis]|nr:hypothetical protein [Lambiella insularis]
MAEIIAVTIVDSPTAIEVLLNCIEDLPSNPPSLYLDLEGVSLSRHGSISMMQLYVLPANRTFLIDIHILQDDAFRTPNRSGLTLKSILESESVPKVFFDVRNDADALFAHYQVFMRCVQDIQLLEAATRSSSSKRCVAGLAKCIEHDLQLSDEAKKAWKARKENGVALFAPEHGGSYEVFNIRPMIQQITQYCTNDVMYLPMLWQLYSQKISPQWAERVQQETSKRLLLSKDASYEPSGKDKALSPWAKLRKDGKANRSGDRGETGLPSIGKGHQSAAEISASKAAQKIAARQPQIAFAHQTSVEKTDLQQPSQTRAGQKVTGAMRDNNENSRHLLSLANLSIRYQSILDEKLLTKPSSAIGPAADPSNWICSTCDRMMQALQKHDHLTGKPHIARLKQKQGVESSAPIHITTTKQNTPLGSTIPVTKSRKPKAQRNIRPQQGGTGLAVLTPPQAGPSYPNWGFTGFSGSSDFHRFCVDSDLYDMEDLNYGLCDTDCGWCGHCMDGVDI